MVSLLVEGMTDYLLIEPENQYDNLHFVLVTPYIFHKEKYSSLREHAVAPGIVLKHPGICSTGISFVTMNKQFGAFGYSRQKV